MPKIRTASILLPIVLLASAQHTCADSYRCGRKLIRSGDSSADVLRICGQPRFKDRAKENLRVDGVEKRVPVERWYYKKSNRSLEHMVMIHGGRVISIVAGSR